MFVAYLFFLNVSYLISSIPIINCMKRHLAGYITYFNSRISIQIFILIGRYLNAMENSIEYQLYIEVLDDERSAWGRRTAIRRLSECKTEESLYYLNELIVDRYCLVPDWLKKIAREYYVSLCLEFL